MESKKNWGDSIVVFVLWKVKRTGMILFALVLTFHIMVLGSALAATIYVNDDGQADYTTIQAAVENASSGDEIIVMPGVYIEKLDIEVEDLTIISQSGNPADTRIQAANSSFVFDIWTHSVSIKGFGITGTGNSGGIEIHYGMTDCHIENNKLSDCGEGISLSLYSINNVVNNNTISNCQEGISLSEAYTNTLSNNLISNCNIGIVLLDSYNNVLDSNVVTENEKGISLIGETIQNTLRNNEVKINEKCGLYINNPSSNLIYNNYFNNTLNVDFGEYQDQNTWNTTRTSDMNIIGGPYIGGNFWAKPDGSGFSETTVDKDGDGIADSVYNIGDSTNIDYLPLTDVFEPQEPIYPVVDFKTNTTSGYAPLSILFTDLSENATERSWDFENEGKVDSIDEKVVHVYTVPGNYTVKLTATNENGTDSKLVTINVLDAGGSENSRNSGSSQSSGGGGGGSPEPARNVEVKELAQVYITNGKNIKFDFKKNVTCVVYVSFDAKKTAGKTTTIVEMLKGKSALVSELPAGEVYRSFNVWVGNGGYATPKNIENTEICFRVEKDWVQEKQIDQASISLNRYSEKKWEQLQANLSGEDDKFLYFTADVPALSSFAITGNVKSTQGRNGTNILAETRMLDENETEDEGIKTEPDSEQKESPSTPGFELGYGLMGLLVLFLYRRK